MRHRRKIPVVIFDSGLKGDDYVSFVATDNTEGGRMGGERLVESMNGERQGRAAALRRRPRQHRQARGGIPRGDESPSDRPGDQLESVRRRRRRGRLQEDRVDPERLQEARRQPRRRRHLLPQRIVHVRHACACSRTTAGRARCNSSASTRPRTWSKGLHDGVLDGIVLQDPVQMGYLAVKTLVAHIKGEQVEKRIDTGVHVATQREHGTAGDERAGPSGSRKMSSEHLAAALRDARHSQGVRRDRSRSTASTCRSRRARSAALIGQNGAGKSTLMSILAGALAARCGRDAHRRRAVCAARIRSRRAAPAWR